ncbi:hypothetical protein EVAR_38376_1 [Eumeta japonica]|uniref:Uncharacterized protein n=1 Tax=Eumeta variegata TaxID=151549 RepID=A0A4C1XWD9_EUMVA|nr:hypothetical protein EVAR_38376_1 [Eumeta japonica]
MIIKIICHVRNVTVSCLSDSSFSTAEELQNQLKNFRKSIRNKKLQRWFFMNDSETVVSIKRPNFKTIRVHRSASLTAYSLVESIFDTSILYSTAFHIARGSHPRLPSRRSTGTRPVTRTCLVPFAYQLKTNTPPAPAPRARFMPSIKINNNSERPFQLHHMSPFPRRPLGEISAHTSLTISVRGHFFLQKDRRAKVVEGWRAFSAINGARLNKSKMATRPRTGNKSDFEAKSNITV